MAAKHINKPPLSARGATGRHATKTQEERQEYKHHVRFASGAGETVERASPPPEGISAPPDIPGPALPVGLGDKRRIAPPAIPAAADSLSWNRVVHIVGFVGIVGIVAIVGVIYQYGRLSERVDSTSQNVKELDGKQDEARDHVAGIVERVAKLEAQVEGAIKSGVSTADFAAEVASLRQALGAQPAQLSVLARRIEAVEARLVFTSTRPSTP